MARARAVYAAERTSFQELRSFPHRLVELAQPISHTQAKRDGALQTLRTTLEYHCEKLFLARYQQNLREHLVARCYTRW